MQDLISLLNQNAAAIQAFFACVVGISTVLYVILTFNMWREMRYTNQRLDQPDVQVVLEPVPESNLVFGLTLRNWGNVPVYDVRLGANPDHLPSFTLGPLRNLKLFTTSIPILPERQEIKTLLFDYHDVVPLLSEDKTVAFTVSYKTLHGKQCSQTYSYNLDVYLQLPFIASKGVGDIVKRLENLAKELRLVSANVEKIADAIATRTADSDNGPREDKCPGSRLMRWIARLTG